VQHSNSRCATIALCLLQLLLLPFEWSVEDRVEARDVLSGKGYLTALLRHSASGASRGALVSICFPQRPCVTSFAQLFSCTCDRPGLSPQPTVA